MHAYLLHKKKKLLTAAAVNLTRPTDQNLDIMALWYWLPNVTDSPQESLEIREHTYERALATFPD